MSSIKNQKDLDKAIEQKIIKEVLEPTREYIYEIIKRSLEQYYGEYTPILYKRQEVFLNSLIKTDVKKVGNSYMCQVKLDERYLHTSFPAQEPFVKLGMDKSATGQQIAEWANRDDGLNNHGGTINVEDSDGFWDRAMEQLGGDIGIIALLEKNLKASGLI